MNLKKLKGGRKRSRLAISEVMGAILLIAITIAVGFSAWAWVRSASLNSENQLANATSENYEIVNVNFSSSAGQAVTVWLYNSGSTTVYIKQILISNATSVSSQSWTYSTSTLSGTSVQNCGYCLAVPKGSLIALQLTATKTFAKGVIYQFKTLSEFGTTFSYSQEK